MVYRWASGYRARVSPHVAAEEIERIRLRDSVVDLGVLVDESRPDSAPLHPAFEWNDARAGLLYRQEQARYILRSIRLIVEQNDSSIVTPVYVKLEHRDGDEEIDDQAFQRAIQPLAYVNIRSVAECPLMRQRLLQQALRDLANFKRRYAALADVLREGVESLEVLVNSQLELAPA